MALRVGRAWRVALLIAATLLLQACKTELYTGLDERQANSMAAVLMQNGIPAERRAGEDGGLTLYVEESRFAEAVRLLDAAGLPQQRFATLGEVFQSNGLVSSPTQERAQFIYAMSQELSHTVSQMDGVRAARVHVVIPENDMLKRGAQPSSASVFISYEPDMEIDSLIPKLKALVAGSISGLDYERVSVISVPAAAVPAAPLPQMASFLGLDMPARSARRAGWLLAMGMLAGGALAAAATWYALRRRRDAALYRLEP
ncbi:EscJ/YscJ/HrcJ family type III secretion inner membrane ring protein [Bordetella genomosp. 7]|uniref:type III secretion system inner membrane ring lipoprotein SctJ n=1 Tax=Bordetella genomosp. 7 TaxID=1416805 RepID=UPI000B9E269B|nr:type III secretion inner membrane ring lipoprotein SctJ [Bordetella genomosp. 7]OZI17572.1 EscJ/YscJ/HrcJ family type III secretion inner membrane ring protein [Bordetella genomosp. 7]